MKAQMIKSAGGAFVPLDDMQAEALKKFRNGEQYEIEIKLSRNPQFHRKVFAFFKFCFDHWSADKTEWQFQDEQAQFDTFRKNLTVLAGYFDKTYTIKGDVRIEPKSLAYGNMEQAEFERCYNSLINAAMKHIFNVCDDPQILDRLYAFF
ncbi:DUF1367 family protein [Actinobacillus pleuropneumoniae]|uniref:DUF1367 family protein n=1 Tax=Actinobacillus pleuropneumoniae TaxID=715 RepID=A0A9Q4DGI6_ACTPL|nr:DUF1367 family protein [Actinobacillus pleuropneumoniae]MCL7721921.1 DUF1367 family protein [Actinobacillus pleuropneumoniae]MCL7726823.1 DUF1367 family protein [Actinobacillus pleuropneumoniae]MCL7730321.1 DUF1367 family protein [Actinobacillus pleuropneumoniae]MCY6367432.1 DUF1367 family protein [Actinobacillus pleuropneumoniae]MCY6384299.1 DUF1367 family protein [Actinobacillus pleuropneumoniae]